MFMSFHETTTPDGRPRVDAYLYEPGSDRVMLPLPVQDPALPFLQVFETREAARERILACSPDIEEIPDSQMQEAWRASGWTWPGPRCRRTSFLCLCGEALLLQTRSINAGIKAPHGALYHVYYECLACQRQYARARQEVATGWLEDWCTWAPDGTSEGDCEDPREESRNPWGFQEILLDHLSSKNGTFA